MAANAAAIISLLGAPAAGEAPSSTVVISVLSRSSGIGAGDRNRRGLFGGSQDDRRLGGPHAVERTDALSEQIVQRGGVADAHLEHEAVFTRDVVHLLDLGKRHERGLRNGRAAALVRPDEHEREESEVDRSWVDAGVVTAHRAPLLELPDALEHRRGREPDAATDLGVRDPGVSLQRLEDGQRGLVDHAPNLYYPRRIVKKTSDYLSIRLHMAGYAVESTVDYATGSSSNTTSIASAIWPAVMYRSAGSTAIARLRTMCASSGTSGRTRRTSGGGSSSRRCIVSRADGAANGSAPVSISSITQPSEYRSDRASATRRPATCSGLT